LYSSSFADDVIFPIVRHMVEVTQAENDSLEATQESDVCKYLVYVNAVFAKLPKMTCYNCPNTSSLDVDLLKVAVSRNVSSSHLKVKFQGQIVYSYVLLEEI